MTRKIVRAACRIKARRQTELRLGNLAIQRDWGWAPEYVDAMWRILQHATAEDFVIATGEAHSLESFTTAAFASVSLDWRDHVTIDEALHRPTEILFNKGNAAKARAKLGWIATSKMPDVVRMMVDAELEAARNEGGNLRQQRKSI